VVSYLMAKGFCYPRTGLPDVPHELNVASQNFVWYDPSGVSQKNLPLQTLIPQANVSLGTLHGTSARNTGCPDVPREVKVDEPRPRIAQSLPTPDRISRMTLDEREGRVPVHSQAEAF
jgi:hypothetical protein